MVGLMDAVATYDNAENAIGYSVYAYQNEIRNGFVTCHGGHRFGICGTAVTEVFNSANCVDSLPALSTA